jgi:riboflavin synthase
MFTGIIERIGIVKDLVKDQQNLHIKIQSDITNELKIDQSVAHNGICLTVVELNDDIHTVTAIHETIQKTNLNELKIGDRVNLERCMIMNGRLDGHIVQGHVDTTAKCISKIEQGGSWLFTFEHARNKEFITVEKGSICVNGISLTVVDSKINQFSVAIIPYTYEHTNLSNIEVGNHVNLEFDILGKYVAKLALFR